MGQLHTHAVQTPPLAGAADEATTGAAEVTAGGGGAAEVAEVKSMTTSPGVGMEEDVPTTGAAEDISTAAAGLFVAAHV